MTDEPAERSDGHGGVWLNGEHRECVFPERGPEACRTVDSEGLPRSPRSVARKARAAGWTVAATMARGARPPGRGMAGGRVVGTVALRMRHPGGHRAVAVWWEKPDGGWKADTFVIATPHGIRSYVFAGFVATLTELC